MATFIKILSESDIKAFEFPPEFNGEERKKFFSLPIWANEITESIRTPMNKVGFILQLGYFRATNRFFTSDKFHMRDVHYVASKADVAIDQISFDEYFKSTNGRHQDIIRERLGFRRFDDKTKEILVQEAVSLCSNQIKPRLMFMSLLDFLIKKRIEIPTYRAFSEVITNGLNRFEKSLLSSIQKDLKPEERVLLDSLLELSEADLSEKKKLIKPYKITLLKKINQSRRPKKIRENIDDLQCLKSLFEKVEHYAKNLQLSPQSIKYYAELAIRSQVFQISRREENRYLLLIAFVIHQYYKLNDAIVDVLILSSQATKNSAQKENKEKFYETRQSRYQFIGVPVQDHERPCYGN